MMEAFGGHGEYVEKPDEIRPALERAFNSGKAALVNVIMDPGASRRLSSSRGWRAKAEWDTRRPASLADSPLSLYQRPAQDLSGRVLGHRVDELDLADVLESRHPLGDEAHDFVR